MINMLVNRFKIEHIPAVLYGADANRVFLFIHGKLGQKEEAAAFAAIVSRYGWQVLGIDLPEHGERKSEGTALLPWLVQPELQTVLAYAQTHWTDIGLRANSIGAWFSLLSFPDVHFRQCLFVSPILDLEKLIRNMMCWSAVTEEQLEREGRIQTGFGETLSWEYLTYVRSHPISRWESPTAILYAGKDQLTDRDTVDDFVRRHTAQLTVMADGEHWFHTPEQLAALQCWTEAALGGLAGTDVAE